MTLSAADRERIEAIRERADKATDGPWAWEATGEKSNDYSIGTAYDPTGQPISGRFTTSDDPESGVWMEDAIVRRYLIGEGENGRFADAEFIAHAREDVPWLLSQLSALSEALDTHERLKTQALAIEALLREAEVGSCTLPEGVKALVEERDDARLWSRRFNMRVDELNRSVDTFKSEVAALSEALSAANEEIARLKATTT